MTDAETLVSESLLMVCQGRGSRKAGPGPGWPYSLSSLLSVFETGQYLLKEVKVVNMGGEDTGFSVYGGEDTGFSVLEGFHLPPSCWED